MKLRYSLLLTFWIFLFACKGQVKDDSFVKSKVIIQSVLGTAIDSLLQIEEETGFSGSVIVVKNDTIILQNGYGFTDKSKTYEISPDTKFYLASTTKGVTGTVALLLEQSTNFSTKDSLKKFFSDLPSEFMNITIHDMLIHKSGLSNKYETFGYTSLEENISLVFGKTLVENPGFIYSGAGYWLTAAVIEKVARKPYEQFVYEALFKPANMNNTSFWFETDEDNNENVAQKLNKFPPEELDPNWGFRASSGILTNISDFYKYFKAISGNELWDEGSFDKLIGPYVELKSGIGIGYGWYTSTTNRKTSEIWSRGGESFGHNSAIRWFKDENVLIAILTNSGQIEGENREANITVSDKIENLIFE